MICKNFITGLEQPNCTVIINDWGIFQCGNCRTTYTKKALENALKQRFGESWGAELQNLKWFKRNRRRRDYGNQ